MRLIIIAIKWARHGGLRRPLIALMSCALLGLAACPLPLPINLPARAPLPRPPSAWASSKTQVEFQWVVDRCLAQAWLRDWKEEEGRKPRVLVQPIENLSQVEIDTARIASELELALEGSRFEVEHVASGAQAAGAEFAADILLRGVVDEVEREHRNAKDLSYALTVELIATSTGEPVCHDMSTHWWQQD